MSRYFKHLDIDTKIFGFKVAKLIPSKISPEKLSLVLEKLRAQGIRLVYWPSDSNDKISQRAAKKFHGILCSEQVTYLTNLKKINTPTDLVDTTKIYRAKTPTDQLKHLAIQAGMFSRFRMDPYLPEALFIKLYNAWIKNSVNGSIATRVIVIRHKNSIVAMATLGEKNKRGDIGLLAVNKKYRGKKLGSQLVYAALRYFANLGLNKAQVVTQKANIAACKLYEKCGLSREKTENFYHFWL